MYFDGYHAPDKILLMREDVHGGVTTVTDTAGVRTLYTNGKFQGNTGWENERACVSSRITPRCSSKTIAICWSSASGRAPHLRHAGRLPLAEDRRGRRFSPSILIAARTYFTGPNLGAIDDPRVTIHHADGRNFILVEEQRYDLISMELSSIWFAGASENAYYSREFYQLVHQRMKPGAVFQQWVQLHHVRPHDFATILHTLRQQFAHVTLFYGGGQGILVASDAPLVTSRARGSKRSSKRRAWPRPSLTKGRAPALG